jgi:predicted DNA binding CopG/RHH family protein
MAKKDARLQLRVPSDLASAAKRKAARQDRSLSQIMRDMLRAWVSGRKADDTGTESAQAGG